MARKGRKGQQVDCRGQQGRKVYLERKGKRGKDREEKKERTARKGLRGKDSKERTDFHIRSNIFLYLQGRYRPIFSDQI